LSVEEMKAALVLCEDRHDDAHLRQADINRHYGCKMTDLADRLLVLPRRRKQHNYSACSTRTASFTPPPSSINCSPS
jgi:hypothetical protein